MLVYRISAASALVALFATSACAPLTAAGSAIGTAGTVMATADRLASAAGPLIEKACREYAKARTVAETMSASSLLPDKTAAKLRAIESFGDAACANPPKAGALSTAIWLGELAVQIKTLTGRNQPADNPNG